MHIKLQAIAFKSRNQALSRNWLRMKQLLGNGNKSKQIEELF